MELKVWVEGIQRIVCGVNDGTTCQDVVYALAHATGKTGRFTLVEKWRNNERLLSPQDHPLKVLSKWGEYASDVQLILRRSALDALQAKSPTTPHNNVPETLTPYSPLTQQRGKEMSEAARKALAQKHDGSATFTKGNSPTQAYSGQEMLRYPSQGGWLNQGSNYAYRKDIPRISDESKHIANVRSPPMEKNEYRVPAPPVMSPPPMRQISGSRPGSRIPAPVLPGAAPMIKSPPPAIRAPGAMRGPQPSPDSSYDSIESSMMGIGSPLPADSQWWKSEERRDAQRPVAPIHLSSPSNHVPKSLEERGIPAVAKESSQLRSPQGSVPPPYGAKIAPRPTGQPAANQPVTGAFAYSSSSGSSSSSEGAGQPNAGKAAPSNAQQKPVYRQPPPVSPNWPVGPYDLSSPPPQRSNVEALFSPRTTHRMVGEPAKSKIPAPREVGHFQYPNQRAGTSPYRGEPRHRSPAGFSIAKSPSSPIVYSQLTGRGQAPPTEAPKSQIHPAKPPPYTDPPSYSSSTRAHQTTPTRSNKVTVSSSKVISGLSLSRSEPGLNGGLRLHTETSPPLDSNLVTPNNRNAFVNDRNMKNSRDVQSSSPPKKIGSSPSRSQVSHLGTPKSRRNLLSEFKRHDLEEELNEDGFLGIPTDGGTSPREEGSPWKEQSEPEQQRNPETSSVPSGPDPRFCELLKLVNAQRDKLKAQEAELTHYDAEIVFWEEKQREHQRQVEHFEREARKLEVSHRDGEDEVSNLDRLHLEDELEIGKQQEKTLASELTLLRSKLANCESELLQCKNKIRRAMDELSDEKRQSEEQKQQREVAMLAEIESLQLQITDKIKEYNGKVESSEQLEAEVRQLEASIGEKKKQVDDLVKEMKDANLQSLSYSLSDEIHNLIEGVAHKSQGSTRKIIGSPRQLENAVPTSKNPSGVWV